MINGTLFGKPIVFAQEDTLLSFYCELVSMMDLHCGQGGVLKSDEICSIHFDALKRRLWELNHWNDDCCDKIYVVGLGDG